MESLVQVMIKILSRIKKGSICIIYAGMLIVAWDSAIATESQPLFEVNICPESIQLPVGRIVLLRVGTSYGAIKFTKAQKGPERNEYFAQCESYYQGDGTGDFSKSNVNFRVNDLKIQNPPLYGMLYFIKRVKMDFYCGPIKLLWGPDTAIVFFNQYLTADQKTNISVAPTVWTDISQIDLAHPQLKWYKPFEVKYPTTIQMYDWKKRTIP
jgi:hypothetical protein